MRRFALPTVGLLIAALVAGCSGPVPTTPTPTPTEAPVVTSKQEDVVMEAITTAFATADAAKSIDALKTRVSSPALDVRRAQYAIATASKNKTPAEQLSFDPAMSIVAATTSWPRFFMVISKTPSDKKAPYLMVVRQGSAREPYRLWGWSRMLEIDHTPGVADPQDGATMLSPDEKGLLMTPRQAIERYADVREKRGKSSYAKSFGADKMRKDLDPQIDAMTKNVKSVGSATNTFAPMKDVFAVRTGDGGAWVVGGITNNYTAKVSVAGGKLNFSDATMKGLSKTTTFTQSVTIKSVEIVSFYIPSKGDGDTVSVLAAEHDQVEVKGK